MRLFREPEHAELELVFPAGELGNDTIERVGKLFPEATINWSVAKP